MVTFTPMGRMGNYLFECATTYAYAKKHNLCFSIPTFTNDNFHCPIYLPHLRHPEFTRTPYFIRIDERQHQYVELPFDESWRPQDILLTGYFQSEKYFKEYRNEILNDFAFKWEPILDTVSIHVRRGDYVTFIEKHPKIPDEYYHQSIEYFSGRGFFKFKVFSDDIPWCKEYFTNDKFRGVEFSFSEGQTIEEDMRLMSCCIHQICSSSTFAWWGYWLNRNNSKIGIFPKLWFTPGFGGLDTSDIVPPECLKF